MQFIRYEDGTLVGISEQDADAAGGYGLRLGDVQEVVGSFEDVSRLIGERIASIGQALTTSVFPKPREIAVEFGIQLEGSAGLPAIVSSKLETHIQVTATWQFAV